MRTLVDVSNAKITEQDSFAISSKNVRWPDVAMDYAMAMGMLKGSGNLPGVGCDRVRVQACPCGVIDEQGAMRGVIHGDISHTTLYPGVVNSYNVGVFQGFNGPSYIAEVRDLLIR
jgi:hypothetical protein